MNTSISVVLPAAGSGERFGCLTPKQYCCIVNRPLICYTVESFIRIPWIFKIVVVSSSNSVEQMKMCLSSFSDEEQKKIQIIQGGASRHQSIYLGLRSLKDDAFPPEIVVIHDGVRPVVPEKVLEKIVDAAKTYGAAGVVRPLVSTVVSRTEESFLDKSLDRRKYCASEMPQAFNYSMMLESYGKCSEYDLEFGTECLQIAHSYGNIRPKLIMSDEDLWKVTHKKDLYATEGMIKENIPVLVNTDGIGKELLHYLQSTLCKKFQHVKMGSTLSTETSLKNVNQVKFHQQKGLSDVLLKECEHIPLNNTTVHVITQPENRTIDHSEIRKRIKEHALMLRKVNSCIYFICMTNEERQRQSTNWDVRPIIRSGFNFFVGLVKTLTAIQMVQASEETVCREIHHEDEFIKTRKRMQKLEDFDEEDSPIDTPSTGAGPSSQTTKSRKKKAKKDRCTAVA